MDHAPFPEPRLAFAIMAKASEPGEVKTRLVPPLSLLDAAKLNTSFLADASANILAAAMLAPIDGFVAYAALGSEAFFVDNLPTGMRLLPPRQTGLGKSLTNATADLLAQGYSGICLVNCDSPTLPTAFLVETARILLEHKDRAVLGPSNDGGYYLIGLRRLHRRLFEDIAWSTNKVLAQTLERAAEIGLEVVLLPEWYDVDDGASLRRLRDELMATPLKNGAIVPFKAPHTRAYLKSPEAPQLARLSV